MELKINSREKNALLEREEIELSVSHPGDPTPSREDIRDKLVAKEDLDEDEVIVQHVKTPFGSEGSKALVKVYDSNDRLMEVESDYSLVRNGFKDNE